ncbi:MAG TPA: hypothetical protein VIK52_11285 [Opitutaceae bacterium]
MLIDITVPPPLDEPLPPPAWLVGGIVATVIFVAAALLAALPQDRSHAPVERADPVLHAGGFASVTKPQPAVFEPNFAALPDASRSTPIPFDPINLSLPLL